MGVDLKIFLIGRVAVEGDRAGLDQARFPGRQARLLFAYLVTADGRPVPRDEIAGVVWGDDAPATWEKALTVLASKLRATLAEYGANGSVSLTSTFGCYRLDLPDGTWVDIAAAQRAADEAEQALAVGDVERAKSAGGVAVALMRQTFLPGEDGAWIDAERSQLTEAHRRALGALADAALRTGAPVEAVKWAAQTIALEPFRETGYRQLMRAHADAGNRAEALRVYDRCRRLLADELGTYPSPQTDALYRDLLALPTPPEPLGQATSHDPPPSVHPPTPARRRASRARMPLAAIGVVTTATVVMALVITASRVRHVPVTVAANTIVALDPNGTVAAAIPVGSRPVAITAGAGALWVANLDDATVSRVDPSAQRVVRTIPSDGDPIGLEGVNGGIWVVNGTGGVTIVDPKYNRLASSVPLGREEDGVTTATSPPRPMLAAFGSVWIVDPDGLVTIVSAASHRVTGSVDVGNGPTAIVEGAGSVWVANGADGTVTRIDPSTLVTTTVPVGHGPSAIAVNEAGVWVANAGDDAVVRVDTGTGTVAGTTKVGDDPTALIATPAGLWVANARDGTVMRLDPRTGRIRSSVRLGSTPDALLAFGGRVWVAVAPAPPALPTSGGVARFTIASDLPSYDPALDQTPELLYATCAQLVTYPDLPAPYGSRIVPEVAAAVPVPTDGGRVYTFTVRPGFRFSPPSNAPVSAATFKTTIDRVTDPRLQSQFATEFSAVAGYRAYVTGRAGSLAGVTAHGSTLTIRLSRPDGAFLAHLAAGAACAVPDGTPPTEIPNIPSAGPYYIASYTPRQQLLLRRNPNYGGDRPARLDQFVLKIGVDPARALAEVEAGTTDYAFDGLPRAVGADMEARYGAKSPAARHGYQQYFVNAANSVRYLQFNTSRPPFSSVRLRQAVNNAIDRPALVAVGRRFAPGIPSIGGQPTDSYLAPVMEGTTDTHVYPVDGPDLERARQLAGHIHTAAVMYTPNVSPFLEEAHIVRRDLHPLGIDVQIQEMPLAEYFVRIGRRGEPFDLAVVGWINGSTDPADAIDTFASPIHLADNVNFSYLDAPAFDRTLAAAEALSGTKRYRTLNALALELERDIAPAAAFETGASGDLFSRRIGCQLYQPVYGIDLGALCVRR